MIALGVGGRGIDGVLGLCRGGDVDLFVCFKFGMRGNMVREGGYGWGKGGSFA